MTKRSWYLIYGIGSLGIILIMGAYIVYSMNAPSRAIPFRPTATSTLPEVIDTTATSTTSSSAAATTTASQPSPSTNNSAACAEDLFEATRASNTEYERGSILVGFTANVDFVTAMGTLTKYDVRVLNRANAETNYPSLRLITATVNDGQEFIKICSLRGNANVRYADLNKLLDLHD